MYSEILTSIISYTVLKQKPYLPMKTSLDVPVFNLCDFMRILKKFPSIYKRFLDFNQSKR